MSVSQQAPCVATALPTRPWPPLHRQRRSSTSSHLISSTSVPLLAEPGLDTRDDSTKGQPMTAR
eukprot:CAMPEP_0170588422 /NCGR_PEP_ID=MMETSP0224-20130122/10821_1 /TAXON_ID=285029 /ORGANISM="Togula jolla, Strain CCCM 725" /LENGTH=63 /DNA_ID=CAMNT_0010912137 /DNA_START=121 /DNA_END=312 /DNA_ORIENTATION=-